jgi:hypothetical protein
MVCFFSKKEAGINIDKAPSTCYVFQILSIEDYKPTFTASGLM